ncbi:LL-diaminopimelate aminotransferase [Malaciobacter marinus]|uniref:Alanine transaminase n=1 Tax=Malaciobacter marinus TaxID=505249 RepID=A0A347TH34_9BACT|nr:MULTISPECIES: LL-diaminopimelate aminotransferase [Malaciobacter]AXX85912.1 aspartate aminotransferase, class I and II aminotransferase [Malaciobacter marinus]PHO12782.1 alanine transaminase [Malaciobacter marinus]PHO14967.1 alanine transaminase [Malaciobacter marinus]RYA24289.1 pyridoxal phosphate-dependent aminotransferase [Malaciobacter halophilus]
MFPEIEFERMKRLPNYVFAEVNEIKMDARRRGEDIIDFSMGNPDGPAPQHIVDKLKETADKPKNHGYSASAGIYKLRLAICNWYKRKYGVDYLDPNKHACATMGSKEGYVHLIQAIVNVGDVAVVPDPTYPIHSYAFMLAGGAIHNFELPFDEQNYRVDEDLFFERLNKTLRESIPKVKYVLVNFPHNPTCATVRPEFYQRLVDLAKKERFYIISDIAYADITFDGYKTPSIFQAKGAIDVAVESFTLSKSYNMAGWRVGFIVGNEKLVGALKRIKSWLDYGMFTPIQVAATVALDGPQDCVAEHIKKYNHRRDVMIEAFKDAGWEMETPNASMFIWAKIPEKAMHLGSMEFSKQLLTEAKVAVSPGIGFGHYGDKYVRIALIENEKRIRQAAKNIKKYLKTL